MGKAALVPDSSPAPSAGLWPAACGCGASPAAVTALLLAQTGLLLFLVSRPRLPPPAESSEESGARAGAVLVGARARRPWASSSASTPTSST